MTQSIKNFCERSVHVGVVGVGEVAKNHLLPALVTIPGATLAGVVGHEQHHAVAVAKEFGTRAYLSIDTMIADPQVDALIIATPDALHAPMAIAAMQAGKHVFVEKPMATTVKDAEDMIVAAAKYGVKLAVGYHLRFHAGHKAVRALVDRGEIGVPRKMQIVWTYSAPETDWRKNGPQGRWWALAAIGTHAIDLAAFLLGCEISQIRSMVIADPAHPGEREHTATVLLECTGGLQAEIFVSNRVSLPRTVTIEGSTGTITCVDTLAARGAGKITMSGRHVPFVPVDPYREELTDWIEAIRHDREPSVNGDIGFENVVLLNLL